MKEEGKHGTISYEQYCWSYGFVFRISHFEGMYEYMKNKMKYHFLYKIPKKGHYQILAIIALYILYVPLMLGLNKGLEIKKYEKGLWFLQ